MILLAYAEFNYTVDFATVSSEVQGKLIFYDYQVPL